ncbi:MAG TPA: hypothetical protein VF605_00590 [Allosphingosinicella sp.]|jgi:hypothetical protein
MMAALIIAIIQGAAMPELPTEQEIVVTGRRMGQVQIAAGVNRMTGKTRCRVTVSSGDPVIDREVCEIAKACGMVKPRKRALIEACVRERKDRFLRTYVAPERSVG